MSRWSEAPASLAILSVPASVRRGPEGWLDDPVERAGFMVCQIPEQTGVACTVPCLIGRAPLSAPAPGTSRPLRGRQPERTHPAARAARGLFHAGRLDRPRGVPPGDRPCHLAPHRRGNLPTHRSGA